jgi:superfamily II DNA or RNA helicase
MTTTPLDFTYYPEITDENFQEKLLNKHEFAVLTKSKSQNIYPENYQIFIRNFMNKTTPYRSILLYHQMGVGKTLSAIQIAESFKREMNVVILIKNKNILNNFRLELISRGNTPEGAINEYTQMTFEEFQSKSILEKNEIIDSSFRKINKEFTFFTFGSFTNKVKQNKLNNFNNSIIIVDEVHNITNNETFDSLSKLLRASNNTRIVLMSATPIYDNISEIFEIASLLQPNTITLPIRSNLVKEGFITTSSSQTPKTTSTSTLVNAMNSARMKLTPLGIEILTNALKGRVSYIKLKGEAFPKRIDHGTLLNTNSKLIVTKCEMSIFQFKGYTEAMKTTNQTDTPGDSLYKGASDACTIVYPENKTSEQVFGERTFDFLKHEVISEYSTKLNNLLTNIKESQGIVLIYSNYVSKGGTELIERMLQVNGYTSYNSRNATIGSNYIQLTSKLSQHQRTRYLLEINSKENMNGEKIKIIIGSPVISEGMSFKCIRQIHILEPSWNLSKIEQVIGRGIRNHSHDLLPIHERNITIFKYISTFRDIKTIDYLKYQISDYKDRSIKSIEYLIKQIAVDCNLFHEINVLTAEHDNLRECEYEKCEYECKPSVKVESKDLTTFDPTIHSKEEIEYFKKFIKNKFETDPVWTLDALKYEIKDASLDVLNLYYTLHLFIQNKIPLLFFGKEYFLTFYPPYFILEDTVSGRGYETGSYLSRFYNFSALKQYTVKQYLDNKGISLLKRKLETLQDTDSWERNFERNRQIIENELVYGTLYNKNNIKDNKFRIVDKRSEKNVEMSSFYYKKKKTDTKDTRRVKTGLVCSSVDPDTLASLIDEFNLPRGTHKQMCKSLLSYFETNNKLVN